MAYFWKFDNLTPKFAIISNFLQLHLIYKTTGRQNGSPFLLRPSLSRVGFGASCWGKACCLSPPLSRGIKTLRPSLFSHCLFIFPFRVGRLRAPCCACAPTSADHRRSRALNLAWGILSIAFGRIAGPRMSPPSPFSHLFTYVNGLEWVAEPCPLIRRPVYLHRCSSSARTEMVPFWGELKPPCIRLWPSGPPSLCLPSQTTVSPGLLWPSALSRHWSRALACSDHPRAQRRSNRRRLLKDQGTKRLIAIARGSSDVCPAAWSDDVAPTSWVWS